MNIFAPKIKRIMEKRHLYASIALFIVIGLPTLYILTQPKNDSDFNAVPATSNKKQKQNEAKTTSKQAIQNRPRNVILLIGDGMGLSQITAASVAKRDKLAIETCPYIGLVRTYAANKLVTDSAAGATAMATGIKTYNGAIGVDMKVEKVKNIVEYAEEAGIATGVITSTHVTHATPACFFSHQKSRAKVNELVALDFLSSGLEVLIGGGFKYFQTREDKRDLLREAEKKGYFVCDDLKKLDNHIPKKLLCLPWAALPPQMPARGDFLPKATAKGIEILNNYENGFFLMVEGGQVDWGGHNKNADYIIRELLDFDEAVAAALAFAAKDGNTLVIITADHETGGLSINGGDLKTGKVEGAFTTDYHTATMVPIFAFGPSAELFTGVIDNTAIFFKIKALLCDEK
jgi:alkaline phosphatase